METVKDYKVTHLTANTFNVQEQLSNGRFGKSCKVDMPPELLVGKNFGETIDLVKLYVKEGRQVQEDRTKIQRANGDKEEIPAVFEEDDYIVTPLPWMRWAKFSAFACMGIGGLFSIIYLTTGDSSASNIVEEDVEVVAPLNEYERIQIEIDELGKKRIQELAYQEELRTLRKQAEDVLRTKVASYNEDINASKDRVIGVDGDIAKLKKQQVTISTIVSDD